MSFVDAETYVDSRLSSGELTSEQIVNLVRAFQLQNGLKVDGKPGPITFKKVDEILAPHERPTLETLPNLVISPDEWLFGIDLDHHQLISGNVSEQFSFVGVSEGTTSSDPLFEEHLRKLRSDGVLPGAYHFARPSSARINGPQYGQPLGEAQNFAKQWELAMGIAGKMLPPVLDMEDEKERLSSKDLIDWTLEWCEHCKTLTGREPIIYTYFSFIYTQLKGYVDELTKYHLWLADYRGTPPHAVPREIPNWAWLFWQFTGSGAVSGISGQCDRNVFRGTRTQLESLLAA
jgi:lysozyme